MLRQESIEAQTVFRGHSGWGSGEFPRAKALLEVVVRSPVCFKDGVEGTCWAQDYKCSTEWPQQEGYIEFKPSLGKE